MNSVVLPAPFSPTTETNSPSRTWSDTPSSACALPYSTSTPSTASSGGPDFAGSAGRAAVSMAPPRYTRRTCGSRITCSAVPSAMGSPRYIASTRSTRAATPFTLWSTSRTALPSARKLAIRSENAPTSPEVSPANGSSTSTTFGLRPMALASSSRRRSANGSVPGRRSRIAPKPTRWAMARARSSTSGSANSRSSASGKSASLMFSSTVCRCSGRECWNTRPTPCRAMRWLGQPATSTPSIRTVPASGRSIPMMSFITVDLPEPLGPISPRISPGAMSSAMPPTATSPPNRLTSPETCSSAVLSRVVIAAPASGRRAGRTARAGWRAGQPPTR